MEVQVQCKLSVLLLPPPSFAFYTLHVNLCRHQFKLLLLTYGQYRALRYFTLERCSFVIFFYVLGVYSRPLGCVVTGLEPGKSDNSLLYGIEHDHMRKSRHIIPHLFSQNGASTLMHVS